MQVRPARLEVVADNVEVETSRTQLREHTTR
jgi:hypothetical protein